MPEPLEKFQILMERIRAGQEDAIQEVVRTYGHQILRVVRRRLHKKLRSQFDSRDFEQSVWKSFFATPLHRYTFDRPEDLVGFLAAVAKNKVVDAIRLRLQGEKKNALREHSLEGSAAVEVGAVADHGPTPSHAAIVREDWDQLQQGLTRPGQRILALLRQGYSQKDIAAILHLSEKTIRRLIRTLGSESIP